ncbi:MAG TPA: AMP-binding protein, partial [Microthrixaceae bacterium]|nr:AMP-binding protein [Microthrixaceae bacterium]
MSETVFYPGAHVESLGDKAAYVMATTGESVSYRELHERANQIAHLFKSHGLGPGDHVAWCMENHPWYLSLAWGAHYAGLYFTAISSRLTAEEVAYIVNDCEAKIFVASPYMAEVAEAIIDDTPAVQHRFAVDEPFGSYVSLEAAVALQSTDDIENAVAGMDMLYSSGTTGRPKGVLAALTGDPLGTPEPLTILVTMLFGANTDTIYLSPAPLYHAAPLRFCMQVQRAGGTVIVMDHFEPEETLRLIEKHRVTFGQFVPTMFVRMLKLPDDVRRRYDTSSLQVAVHAAAPCPIEVKERMIDCGGRCCTSTTPAPR